MPFYMLQQSKHILARAQMSALPSVKRVNCDQMKEGTSGKILTPQEKTSLQFCDKKNGCWGMTPLYLKFWVKLTPFLQKCRFVINFRL